MDQHKHGPNCKHEHLHNDGQDKSKITLVKDPVCGMTIDPHTAKGGSSSFNNYTYYFCNPKCKVKFDAEPVKYVEARSSSKVEARDVEYTCPMHPEIRQKGPGSCPICGMALEPSEFSADHAEDQTEYVMMLKKFWVSAVLSLPLLFITMGGRHFFKSANVHEYIPWLELALATPVVLWGGWPFFERFGQSLKNRNLNMFTLIGLGVGVSYLYSVVAVLFPNAFPPSFVDPMTDRPGLYFEAASVIVALVLLGQVLELKARGQTSAAIKSLLGSTSF